MFNPATDDLAFKLYIPHKSLFIANALRDNILGLGSKKISLHPQKTNDAVFGFEYQKFRARVSHTITHNKRNQTLLHKVNEFCIKMSPHLEF